MTSQSTSPNLKESESGRRNASPQSSVNQPLISISQGKGGNEEGEVEEGPFRVSMQHRLPTTNSRSIRIMGCTVSVVSIECLVESLLTTTIFIEAIY